MARWEKILAQMLNDPDPRNYTYPEAASVLDGLGFRGPRKPKGSHRKWRLRKPDGTLVVVGLVEKGSGTLKPFLVRAMLKQLHLHGLVPRKLIGRPNGKNLD